MFLFDAAGLSFRIQTRKVWVTWLGATLNAVASNGHTYAPCTFVLIARTVVSAASTM